MSKAIFKTGWWHLFQACVTYMLLAFLCMVLGIILFMMSGCSATKRIGGLAAKYPDAARRVCVEMFPPDVSIIHDTSTNTVIEYRKSEPVVVTSYVECDSAVKKGAKRVPCPPSVHSVDTLLIKTTITNNITKTVLNTDKEKQLQTDIDKMTQERDRVKGGRNTWRYVALGAIAVVLMLTVSKLFGGKIKALGGLFKKK